MSDEVNRKTNEIATPHIKVPVTGVAMRPDAARVQWQFKKTISLHGGDVYGLSFAPTGALLACTEQHGAADVRTFVWDVESLRLQVELPTAYSGCSPQRPRTISFSPHDLNLAFPGKKALALWEPREETHVRQCDPCNDIPCCVAFAPDGKSVFAVVNETLEKWDVESGKGLVSRNISNDLGVVKDLDFVSGLGGLVVGCGGGLFLIDAQTLATRQTIVSQYRGCNPIRFAFCVSRSILAVVESHTLRLLEANSFQLQSELQDRDRMAAIVASDPMDSVFAVAFNPVEHVPAQIKFVDAADGHNMGCLCESDYYQAIAFSPCGTQLAIARAGIIDIWQRPAMSGISKPLAPQPPDAGPHGIKFPISHGSDATDAKATPPQPSGWLIATGDTVNHQADALRILRYGDGAVAKLVARRPPPKELLVKGRVRCHGCAAEISFESSLLWGVSGTCGRVQCLSCGSQLDGGQSFEKIDGVDTMFFYLTPWSSPKGRTAGVASLVITTIEG